ncbi:hypothetical protein EVG20_g8934 [Dentipellis fragilis]|uniref:RNI-like protein n=1 Tax=Dentipellis fragilis TaxID=205917 RepID=A0A4Y9Y212_9AGAM|nr:hypothetical protein EVG20_g8934 [Dentipellis fragilis]
MSSLANHSPGEAPTETTSLLDHRHHALSPVPEARAPLNRRPPITPSVNRIRAQGVQAISTDGSLLPALHTTVEEVAFKLIVFLQTYIMSKNAKYARRDVWERWSKEQDALHDIQELEDYIVQTWSDFIESDRRAEEVEECLWCEFPVDQGQRHIVRVVDLLKHPDVPESLAAHRLVFLSLDNTWCYGKAAQPAPTFASRVLQHLDAKVTPRVIHALDTLLQLGYLALLANYILHPPDRPIIAIASGVPNKPHIIPSILVILAFMSSLPSAPFAGETSYTILLFALVLHVLILHLPRPPSPNFFLAPDISLPLSTLLWYEFSRTLFPVLLFYLPAFLISTYLLSVAIADSFPHFPPGLMLFASSPMETRQALLILWGIIYFLILASTALLVLFSASLLSLPQRPSSTWDRYSRPVGLQARRLFVATVTAYATPHPFPPPFNLLWVVFIWLPTTMLRVFGVKVPALAQTPVSGFGGDGLCVALDSIVFFVVQTIEVQLVPAESVISMATATVRRSRTRGPDPVHISDRGSKSARSPHANSTCTLAALCLNFMDSALSPSSPRPPSMAGSWLEDDIKPINLEDPPPAVLVTTERGFRLWGTKKPAPPKITISRPRPAFVKLPSTTKNSMTLNEKMAYKTARHLLQADLIDEFFGDRTRNRRALLPCSNGVCDFNPDAGKAKQANKEPKTLARTLFWHGFWLFPLWFWGMFLLLFPRVQGRSDDSDSGEKGAVRCSNAIQPYSQIPTHWRGMSSRPSKRRRAHVVSFGAASEADTQATPVNVPTSSAFSVREPPLHAEDGIPSLSTLCARVFVANFPSLSRSRNAWEPRDPEQWQRIGDWLRMLPDDMIPKIFAMLRSSCPSLLSHELVKEHFLRGTSITLVSDLGGERPVSKFTVGAVVDVAKNVTSLQLIGFDKIMDQSLAAVISRFPLLRLLNLRGCTKASTKTIEAVSKRCRNLAVLNLNYTSTPPVALAPLLISHKDSLETDAAVAKLLAALPLDDDYSLPALRTLKLRETSITDTTLNVLLPKCPNIEHLDLSFTGVRHPVFLTGTLQPSLEKLSLTSTAVSSNDLLAIVRNLPKLSILAIGALGGGQGKASAIGNTSAMSLTDDTLRDLTEVLAGLDGLESVNLVGNTKLGLGSRREHALSEFIRRVGYRLKRLNLAGITSLRSSDLEGLSIESNVGGEAPRLEELNLNNTKVDDDSAEYISQCASLVSLEVAGSKMTSEGLHIIVDACTRLRKLDVTSCRGVPVVERRRFFEAHESEKAL